MRRACLALLLAGLAGTAAVACDDGAEPDSTGAEADGGGDDGDSGSSMPEVYFPEVAVESPRARPDDRPLADGPPPGPAEACTPRVTAPLPRLDQDLRVLFRKQIVPKSAAFNGSIAVTPDRLAISDGGALHFLDRQGNEVALHNDFSPGRMSAPVADETGTIYVVSEHSLKSFDGDGHLQWSVPGGGLTDEWALHETPIVGPNAVFIADSHGTVRAVDKRTGEDLWSITVPTGLRPGMGLDGDIAVMTSGKRFPVLDAATGHVRFEIATERGAFVGPMGAGAGFGWVTAEGIGDSRTLTTLRDAEGRVRAALPASSAVSHILMARTVDLGGRLLVVDDPDGNVATGLRLRRFDCNGVEGPATDLRLDAGPGYVAALVPGADGHTYVGVARNDGAGGFDVYAFDVNFDEVFRYHLDRTSQPNQGVVSPVVLTDDGVLYVLSQRYMMESPYLLFELLAIQTPSPGPARTGWAGPRFDQGAGAWGN
jgi:outer membrane protein assembly factor BamB